MEHSYPLTECVSNVKPEMIQMSERLYIGIDLGTYQSTVMSSEGVQTTIETVVGRPKDPVAPVSYTHLTLPTILLV